MYMLPLNHFDWVLLRILVRAKGFAVLGKTLRHTPSRRTKDGEFLNELVRLGLIKVDRKGETPLHSDYLLTPEGEKAAEYGEYQFVPEKANPVLQSGPHCTGSTVGVSGGTEQVLRSSPSVSNKRRKSKGGSKSNRSNAGSSRNKVS